MAGVPYTIRITRNSYTTHCWFTSEGFVSVTFKSSEIFLLLKIGCIIRSMWTKRPWKENRSCNTTSLGIRKGMVDFELLLISQGLRKLGIVYISVVFYSLKSCLRLEVNDKKKRMQVLSVALQLQLCSRNRRNRFTIKMDRRFTRSLTRFVFFKWLFSVNLTWWSWKTKKTW